MRCSKTRIYTLCKHLKYKLDISTLEKVRDDKDVRVNDIARIMVRTTQPLVFDPYRRNRTTGSLILIDEATNTTVGAGMILQSLPPPGSELTEAPDRDFVI